MPIKIDKAIVNDFEVDIAIRDRNLTQFRTHQRGRTQPPQRGREAKRRK
jgi:hypothetical protein